MGRPPATNDYQRLQIARAHFEQKLDYREIGDIMHIPKSTANRNMLSLEAEYPEFVKFLEGLGTNESQFTLREQARKTLIQAEKINDENEVIEIQDKIQGDLANMLEQTIGHLLICTPGSSER